MAVFGKWLWEHKYYFVVAIPLVVVSLVLGFKLIRANNEIDSITNQLISTQAVYKLNETIWVQQTAQLNGLRDILEEYNKDLESKISGNEAIGFLAFLEMSFAPVHIETTGKTEIVYIPRPTVVTKPCPDGTTVSFDCSDQVWEAYRTAKLKVEFTHKQDIVNISGYTITNSDPAFFADISIDPIDVDLTVVVDKDGKAKTYIDTHNSNVTLKVNTAVDYEKLSRQKRIYAGLSILIDPRSTTMAGGVQAGYLFDKWYIGTNYTKTSFSSWEENNFVGLSVGGRF